MEYEVYAFAGASEQEAKVVLQGRRGKYEIVTMSKDAPRANVTIRDAVDVNISPLLRQMDEKGTEVGFGIKREAKECRTPRRNPQVEELVAFFERVEQWSDEVHRYLADEIFPIQTAMWGAQTTTQCLCQWCRCLSRKEETTESTMGRRL